MKNTNQYKKDYRKTPEQNKKRIIQDAPQSTTTLFRRWLFYPVLAAVLVLSGVFAVHKMTRLPGITTHEKQVQQERTVVKRVSKKRALEQSYGEAMTLGKIQSITDNSKEATKHYFDAKSIYPRTLEPRIELAKTYLKRCEERGSYCLHVARELMYARYFVTEDTPPKLVKELDHIQRQLDKIYTVKDSTMLYVH